LRSANYYKTGVEPLVDQLLLILTTSTAFRIPRTRTLRSSTHLHHVCLGSTFLPRPHLQSTSMPTSLLSTKQTQPPNMKVHTTLLCVIISFGFDVLAAPAPALEARAGERLGGIDMGRACTQQYGQGHHAKTRGTSCNAWSCNNEWQSDELSLPIDTPWACQQQYGDGVYAWCSGGIYDWGCFRS
jgi:hypothetical protein